jgi:nucleotide-binding universal stress UspA family protein
MFDNVIVGIDGQEGGRDALALAKNLLTDGGRLTLTNVYPGETYVWLGGSPSYRMIEKDESDALLTRAGQDAGVVAELRAVPDPSIGRGLHTVAEDVRADLLVVGSSRRTLVGRVTLGDDTRAALNGAPCAVAVAPAGYAHGHHLICEIGVGYDGSPESEHALTVARSLAALHNAKLSAFEAVSLPTTYYMSAGLPAEQTVEEMVDSARDRLARLEGVEPHAAYGQAPEELAIYSASLDLLVVGSRDYGPIGRLAHGSTTRQLARSARCPLLVLTRAARERGLPSGESDGREAAVFGTNS